MSLAELFPRHCLVCANALSSVRGTYCRVFDALIVDEARAAADCDAFQHDPEAS